MEQNKLSPVQCLLSVIQTATDSNTLKKCILSKPEDSAILKTVVTVKMIGGQKKWQAEIFQKDNKAIHQNIDTKDIQSLFALLSKYGQINLITTAGDCELRTSKSGKTTFIGGEKTLGALRRGEGAVVSPEGNDKVKDRILRGDEPFLKLLGVSDEKGRIYDKKQSKFRQINKFLENIRDIVSYLPKDGPLYVCDLCCGKSYLSFAAFHYLHVILGRDVHMTGVDLKADVIAYCSDVASMLGFDTLHFLCGDIGKFTPEHHPHLVISLHACDTATDLVIENAILWDAKVILSTPCCHHELNHTINCPALAFVTDHSMLRQKLCDAATDGLRLKLLEANGYSVDALELIDPEETPKNILLRAIRKKRDPAAEARAKEQYNAAKSFLLGK